MYYVQKEDLVNIHTNALDIHETLTNKNCHITIKCGNELALATINELIKWCDYSQSAENCIELRYLKLSHIESILTIVNEIYEKRANIADIIDECEECNEAYYVAFKSKRIVDILKKCKQ